MPTRIQAPPVKPAGLTPALVLTFAIGCGLAVGNLYYAQPLTHVIGKEFHVGDAQSGTIVTLTQLGYVCGLFLLAPLGDLLENRKTITVIFSGAVISALAMVSVRSFSALLTASFALGFSSVIAQMLVPFAAHLAPPRSADRLSAK